MKFGVREICDVVFKAKADTKSLELAHSKKVNQYYTSFSKKGLLQLKELLQLYMLKVVEEILRLIAWEGEKTLTFTVEDALLSPIGFSVLSGAGLFKEQTKFTFIHS